MAKLERQLRVKLEEWTAAGLISPAQAQAIRSREAAEQPGLPWGILIFAGFGAVVIGLGVILLFAYNWDKMHKFAKLGVVFGTMAAAHGTGLWLRRRESLRGFAESALLLGTMLFGAGIWLVAQIYHISAHYPNAFFVWAAAALLMAWVLPSVAQGLLATVLLAVWACAEVASFDNHLVVAPLLVLVGTGWLAWRLRSPVLLAAAAVSFAVSAAAGFCFNGTGVFMVLLGVAVAYGSLAWLARGDQAFPAAHVILRVAGMLLYFPLLFILTFHDAAEDLLERRTWYWHGLSMQEWLPVVVVPLVALSLAGLAVRRAAILHECHTPEFRARLAAPPAILLAFLACGWLERLTPRPFGAETAGWIIATIATAVFLYHSVANLWRGCRDTRLGWVIGGSLLMAAWVFARYADLFDSLLARGVMFIVMGAALFAVAIFYHRLKKQARPAAATTAATGKED
jgi:uncharacterized membrane protein